MYPDHRNDFIDEPPMPVLEKLDPKDERLIWQSQIIGEQKSSLAASEKRRHKAENAISELEKEVSNLRSEVKELRDDRDSYRDHLHKAELKLTSKRSKK